MIRRQEALRRILESLSSQLTSSINPVRHGKEVACYLMSLLLQKFSVVNEDRKLSSRNPHEKIYDPNKKNERIGHNFVSWARLAAFGRRKKTTSLRLRQMNGRSSQKMSSSRRIVIEGCILQLSIHHTLALQLVANEVVSVGDVWMGQSAASAILLGKYFVRTLALVRTRTKRMLMLSVSK